MKRNLDHIWDALQSEICLCGDAKNKWYPFCSACYRKVSTSTQNILCEPLSHEFVKAYEKMLDIIQTLPVVQKYNKRF